MAETKVLTGKVRATFLHAWEPKAFEEGDTPKYSIVMVISKKTESGKRTKAKIDAAIEAAKQIGKSKFWNNRIPKDLKITLYDGDEKYEGDPVYKDSWVLNAASVNQPGIVKLEGSTPVPILDKAEFQSGDYAVCDLNFYPYKTGVACGWNNVMKVATGERLSGAAAAEVVFQDFELDEEDMNFGDEEEEFEFED